jgi:hypothetical protein
MLLLLRYCRESRLPRRLDIRRLLAVIGNSTTRNILGPTLWNRREHANVQRGAGWRSGRIYEHLPGVWRYWAVRPTFSAAPRVPNNDGGRGILHHIPAN